MENKNANRQGWISESNTVDKKIIEIKTAEGYLTLEVQDNLGTFICASWRGFTVTVDYQIGQTINTEFTK